MSDASDEPDSIVLVDGKAENKASAVAITGLIKNKMASKTHIFEWLVLVFIFIKWQSFQLQASYLNIKYKLEN
tara:strand:- start:1256 stop:1474 length:219 start_codon:yes stop_codon:yes gene_type:complete